MNIKKKQLVLYLSLFIFLLVLNYFLPYTNDDWAWGSSIGIDRLNNVFSNYNGRYLGNFLVLALTRYKIFKAIIVSLTFTLIAYYMNKIIDKKSLIISLICIILTVLIPMPIFRQVVSWTSGFSNYVPPTLLILVWIYINKNLFEEKKINISRRYCILFLILGFSTVLFMEHLTIYSIILSIFIILYCLKKKIKINLSHYMYLIGSILGSVLMFSNGAYYNIANGTDFYRRIPSNNFIIRAIERYFATIYENLVLNNVVVLFVISLCLTIIYCKNLKKLKNMRIMDFSLFVIWFYTIYSVISNVFIDYNLFGIYLKFIEGIFTLIYFIGILSILVIFPKQFISKNKLLFYLSSIIVLVLPLFVVSPVTPRCFFPMYIFECMFCIQLLFDMFKCVDINKYSNLIYKLLFSTLIISVCCYIWFSFSIFWVSNKMIKSIQTQKQSNENEFILPKLPYEFYMKDPNPKESENIRRFKLFYQISNDVKINFVDYDVWYDIINKK